MIQPKFVKVLEEYGSNRESVTPAVKKAIKEFDIAYEEYESVYEDYEDEEDEEEKQEKYESIKEIEEVLKDADYQVIQKIHHWQKNKDVWAVNSQRMAEGRKNAQNKEQQPQPQTQTNQQTESIQVIDNSVQEVQKEKKNNDMWFVFGALALVVTLGAVNVFKK
jgi:hypothetical protein